MMKFRLEKVLKHRRSLETLARQELAAAQKREMLLGQELAAVRAKLDTCREDFECCKNDGLTVHELLMHQRHLERQGELREECGRRWEEACLEVETRRQRLVVASMDKRLLEKLKEKKAEEFHREGLALENRVLDEIAIQQFYKR